MRVVIRQKMLLERLFVLLLLVMVSHQSGGGCVSLSVDQLTKKLGNGRANNDFVITTSTIRMHVFLFKQFHQSTPTDKRKFLVMFVL